MSLENNSNVVGSSERIDVEVESSQVEKSKELNGLLVSYKDDQVNECVKLALKRKTRVRYKCMDTFSNFLAFGTSGGAIYLYKLKFVTHSSCSLISMIPCDQGSIEVIKFLPNPQTDDLLVAIGTKRGSLVVFKLQVLSLLNDIAGSVGCVDQEQQQQQEQQAGGRICDEIYRAEGFTNHNSIKLIEYDQDLFDPNYPFNKVYICDSTNRLYVLDSTTIYASKQPLRLFYTNHLPSLIFSVNDSEINQINVHRSQLLISTNETTRLFNEQTNQLHMIGTQKRRQGFYGACFFNPTFKPVRILRINNNTNKPVSNNVTAYSSTTSMNDLENLLIFVARPSFRMWQVNHERKVMLTHQFEPLIRNSTRYAEQIVELLNQPVEGEESRTDSDEIIDKFKVLQDEDRKRPEPNCDHFQKLQPIYSSTLGNLLLSYTQQELFVVDPIGAKLIVWHSFAETNRKLIQICCNENELFVWSRTMSSDQNNEQDDFKVERLVLLAPTQFVLELHRLHRYWTMISFVELFCQLFRHRMAIPLTGTTSVITTEGGLLRNVLLNAWDMYESSLKDKEEEEEGEEEEFKIFKKMVDEILEESQQLRQSLDNLTDSRFFLTMTSENIDRLCSEPYASLVSLEVSIADLHSNHVIHFNQNALNRHKSFANLSRVSMSGINRISQQHNSFVSGAKSHLDITNGNNEQNGKSTRKNAVTNNKVIVERLKPAKKINIIKLDENQVVSDNKNAIVDDSKNNKSGQFFSTRELRDEPRFNEILESAFDNVDDGNKHQVNRNVEDELEQKRMDGRCNNCLWPLKRIHLKYLDSIQQIQLKWLQNNLVSDFEQNLQQIETIAFKHGLWHMFLECLAFKKDLDSYITCCMVLNDIRLLKIDQLIKEYGQEELLDKILLQLEYKLKCSQSTTKPEVEGGQRAMQVCLKCNSSSEREKLNSHILIEGEKEDEEYRDKDDEFSFVLVNIFEQLTARRDINIKEVVHQLLKYPKLINNSKLTSSFYLKAIATLIANQTPVIKNRFDYQK